MSENKSAKNRLTFRPSDETRQRIEQWYRADNCSSLNDFVEKAVNDYIHTMYESDQDIPTLQSLTSDGIAWDWMKPCYYQKLYYTCDAAVDLDADNTEDNE